MKKSAAIPASIVALLVKKERIWRNIAQLDEAKSDPPERRGEEPRGPADGG
jgi:hypothetical protein